MHNSIATIARQVEAFCYRHGIPIPPTQHRLNPEEELAFRANTLFVIHRLGLSVASADRRAVADTVARRILGLGAPPAGVV